MTVFQEIALYMLVLAGLLLLIVAGKTFLSLTRVTKPVLDEWGITYLALAAMLLIVDRVLWGM